MHALISGAVGAATLTAIHEGLRRSIPQAPRMDVLGRRAIAKMAHVSGLEPPHGSNLQGAALAGDLVANTLYYSLVAAASNRKAMLAGSLLGLGAGIGAVVLPGPMGLGTKPGSRSFTTALLTIGLYTIGGAAAGLTQRALTR